MPPWFDEEVATLEQRSRTRRGADRLVVFYGSSSFTLWSGIGDAFPEHEVVNLGFGGSTLADCLEYFDRLVVPLAPKVLVVYAGDNDLDNGASPEAVRATLAAMIERKRETLPAVPMAFVSIKVSPARFRFMHCIAYTNLILERLVAPMPDVTFVDVTRRMIGRGIEPLRCCFSEDPLHMNRQGYRIWTKALTEYLDSIERQVGPLRHDSDGMIAPA
ncbi:MAG: GDSL family lipase [Rhodospirillales bacterium]|nr:MAG: GDSL family lipase [Rhodospirillales bacterium]